MPDISMCRGISATGVVCQVALLCYRHTATPSQFQAYSLPVELDPKTGCFFYWTDDKPGARK